MAEIDYDDSLLNISQPCAGIDWDNIETGGTPSEGWHLAKVVKVGGYMHNFKTYTGPRAKVQLQIIEGGDKGKMVYDDINLPHPSEAPGNVNRRVLIASRLGLIPKGTKETIQVNFKLLEGRTARIKVIHKKGTGDNAGKTYANIDFAGYQDPSVPVEGEGAAPAPTQYADI